MESNKVKDKIPGGLADGKPDSDFCPKQIQKGTKVEMEHTDDKEIAKEVAKDHLDEKRDYYNYLEKMEKEMEADKEKGKGKGKERIKMPEASFTGIRNIDDLLLLSVMFKKESVFDAYRKEIINIMKPLIDHEPKLEKDVVLAYVKEEMEQVIRNREPRFRAGHLDRYYSEDIEKIYKDLTGES